ncbi:IstB-like ATP binding protein [Syntrophus gentianae]|uniref:IstB-like ATP binding protein n=1 Tax=Syntrophus gentianae TaxID=43775 RepID=A0A1H8B419_9BACT|nr:IstB-like ATP binding protein [Syntrophus gentianae]
MKPAVGGYDVPFVKVIKMLRSLLAGRADLSWERFIKRYVRPDLLIIDDFGLIALNATQAEDFYEVVTES